jgi:hypothetical protein
MEDVTQLFYDSVHKLGSELKKEDQPLEVLLTTPVIMNAHLESGLIVFFLFAFLMFF